MIPTLLRVMLLSALLGLCPATSWGVQPDEMLKDPQLETRARTISAGLRCLVCQNQSIDDSDAPLARDLRILVRERLQAGDSNSQVTQFLVDRYGDFILLRPRLNVRTYGLWLTPLLIFLIGVILARRLFSANQSHLSPAPPDLSAEEKQKLREVLDDGSAVRPQGPG
jgi:cytochrome c-type biogenesis protein CcmH